MFVVCTKVQVACVAIVSYLNIILIFCSFEFRPLMISLDFDWHCDILITYIYVNKLMHEDDYSSK